MSATIELAQTAKRDHLVALEKQYQARWAKENLFHTDPPTQEECAGLTPAQVQEKFPKWFGNFPYPYMNGSLHLGHAFTISKIEFGAGYQRMLGKRVLFPHGFHVTGLPIKASADKLVREMKMFGPNFENFNPDAEPAAIEPPPVQTNDAPPADHPEKAGEPVRVDKAKKGKLLAKSTGLTYQFQILESIGVPREEIKKFAEAEHWLTYFPPIAIADQTSLGTRIDWRRAFLTTPANPYYDGFVRWQVNKLHALGRIKFGERYTIYSPADGQPCMDHDRSEGEGVGPNEYTGIKLGVVEWGEGVGAELKDKFGGRKVSLVAATLRPETMYGQTNVFVSPIIKYGIYAVSPTEAFVCTARSARNMAYQGIFAERGKIELLAEVLGSALLGTKVRAPLSQAPGGEVYVVPMENVLATKGTGVVTSVPSDSPDDYQTLIDLRKKPEYYKIKAEWVGVDPIPVLKTPGYGDMTAPALIAKMKIQSQKDTKQLVEAKEIAYKEGFYSGTMIVGEFTGEAVQEAKSKVRKVLIERGDAIAYAEPENEVVSRSGDECCVALMDQWYLDYGEAGWRTETERMLAKMNLYSQETRNSFEATLAWLNQWACARTYGLGSKLPWDPHFLVESLSDSTVYMSYYTVANLLHKDMFGQTPGDLGVTPEDMTDEIWEYVFCDGPFPPGQKLSKEKADVLRHSFTYFYPFDIRSSAKDLVPNHLTFCLYNHVAVFPEHYFPLSMRTNGHLLLNGQKMSKSKGNTLTLKESVEKFGADATRLSLADAGDGIEDANFEERSANANILRLHTLLGWCEDMVKEAPNMRRGELLFHDRMFDSEMSELINVTESHYEATNYKDALKFGFYELQSARDWYRGVTSDVGMHADLVLKWISTSALLACPIAPHFAEHIWSSPAILNHPTSIQLALWPKPHEPVDRSHIESGLYMRETVKTIRDAETMLLKKVQKNSAKGKKGGSESALPFDPKKAKSVRIYVSSAFPAWQDQCVQAVKENWSEETKEVNDGKVRDALIQCGLIKDKRAMPFVQAFKKRIVEFGAQTAFRRALPFSEVEVLREMLPYLKRTLGLQEAEVLTVEEAKGKVGEPGYTGNIIDSSEPGTPAFEYRNV